MATLVPVCICHKDSSTITAKQFFLQALVGAMGTSPGGTSNTLVFPARQSIQCKQL